MKVTVKNGTIDEKEKQAYIEYVKEKYPKKQIEELIITLDGDYVDLETHFSDIPFMRIRRITGYLVGTLDRFNNGKRAEEADRVKHSV